MNREPVFVRCPVTNESLMVEACKGGDVSLLEAQSPFLMALLLERISGIVRNLSFRYVGGSINEFEDLAQECFVRIWASRRTFNPKKGRLTTWVWTVCSSILNSDYSKSLKYRSRVVLLGQLTPDEEKSGAFDINELFVAQNTDASKTTALRAAVDELYRRYSAKHGHKAILDALFCVEDDGVFVASSYRAAARLAFPDRSVSELVMSEDADCEELKAKHRKVMHFVRVFVRPVFDKHL